MLASASGAGSCTLQVQLSGLIKAIGERKISFRLVRLDRFKHICLLNIAKKQKKICRGSEEFASLQLVSPMLLLKFQCT